MMNEIADHGPGRPLAGVRVVNTRAADQAGPLTERLAALGAIVHELPMIRIAPPENPGTLVRAVARLENYDWIALTSVNAVEALWRAIEENGMCAADLLGVQVAAVGAATAGRLTELGIRVDLVPDHFAADALIPALKEATDLERLRFLLPRGDLARSFLPEALRDLGAAVDEIVAYRTVPDESSALRLRELVAAGEADAVVFTSSSTVENFVAMLGAPLAREIASRAVFASIGPQTTKTLNEFGLPCTVEAVPHDVPGLADALTRHFARR